MSGRRFMVGSVPYLNAVPLTRWLETEQGRTYAEVRYAPPSQLARLLEAREIDVALVSTAEHFRRPETVFIPGLAIASFGEVLSVRLFSRVPIAQIRSVALDTSSLTSSALVQILLRKVYQIEPTYRPMSPDLVSMLAECDSALLIGDKGMLALENLTPPPPLSASREGGVPSSPSPFTERGLGGEVKLAVSGEGSGVRENLENLTPPPPLSASREGGVPSSPSPFTERGLGGEVKPETLTVLDLGAEWTRWTGLPFVWAVWLTNPEAGQEALSELLHRAYQWGEANLDTLIAQSAEQMRIPQSLCERYLRQVMVYRIDARFLQGLERFRQEWSQLSFAELN